MKLTVNGAVTGVDADPDEPAVRTLRDGLGLTGTKLVCGTGVCGACTVQVDGVPRASCITPTAALADREITTVEGLGGEHPVQRAFAAHDAMQCGYCTPGFVVEAAAFVDGWRVEHGDTEPSREQIAAAMAGHLCRCGAYQGIYAAIAAACAGRHDEPAEPARVDAAAKVTGAARYTTDVRLPGQLEGVIIRSPHAHARVDAIEANGVPLVDLRPADGVVRYAGQPVAAVAAADHAAATAAAARVEVSYTPLAAVTEFGSALAEGAPLVYDTEESRKSALSSAEGANLPGRWQGNLHTTSGLPLPGGGTAERRIERARRRGDQRLVSAVYTTAVQVHSALEPHASVARFDDAGHLHLYISTQRVSAVADAAAERWKLPREQVHVVAEHVGGGFGAKANLTADAVAAVELARLTGSPVRVVLDRAEELTDGGSRPGSRTELSLLADERGRLAALTVDAQGDGGASTGSSVGLMARLMYGTAPRRIRDSDVLTNLPPGAPFRAPNGPQLAWALEQAVDEMAHRLGEDPISLRRRWDGNPKRRALYETAAALPLWTGRPATGSAAGRFRRGVGVAAGNWLYMASPKTQVELTVERGTVVARSATQDLGTGLRTVIANVVREELGLPADRVRVEIGSSDHVPGPPSIGSRSTTSVGPAAHDAAVRLRTALREGAGTAGREAPVAALLDGADGLRVTGRRARDRGGYLLPFSVADAAIGRGMSGAVHVTEVEVDTLLGSVRVTRVWGGLAIGRVYAQGPARNQAEGAIIQGVGYALFEQRRADPATGVLLTDNLEDYHLPGIGDTPEMEIHFHPDGWEYVTGGGVGLGEVSAVGVAASVGNAVYNATGWRPLDLPIRPDRLLEGINR
ncbi:molybdopterin-dependent oxidoreductase [Allonocardiopsis opalescens]|uniref:Xanthine dehydrogenase YagR molybdenum-binding subunit n=1 Tax=Allonocardiopsis opalescens TaxID=1144618 RepID=A0A2T0PTC6_9ACTN|nr:molybdopterin-dependent oxidoreductase [Allonocardiopsis opalescens]PRX92154.1 xanthine dehydrogenase YagR molybdenum-binding subunit [Allonocardiopsis opalescens]